MLAAAAAALIALGTVTAIRAVGSDDGDEIASDSPELVSGLPIGRDRISVVDASLDDVTAVSDALSTVEAGQPDGATAARQSQSGVATESGGGTGLSGGGQGGGGKAGGTGAGTSISAPSGATDAQSGTASEQPAPIAPPAAARSAVRAGPADDDVKAVVRCYQAVKNSLSGDQTLTAALVGTYQGKAAVVLGFRSADRRVLAMVLARDECSILSAHSAG